MGEICFQICSQGYCTDRKLYHHYVYLMFLIMPPAKAFVHFEKSTIQVLGTTLTRYYLNIDAIDDEKFAEELRL